MKTSEDNNYDHKLVAMLRKMRVHEAIHLADKTKVIRVPGGWIYRHAESGGVFVPLPKDGI